MNLEYNRAITLSVAGSRKSTFWKPWLTTVQELYEKLEQPVRSTETQQEYLALRKAQQDELKDVGGFVGGALTGGRRKAGAASGRDVVTLDFDTIPPYGTAGILATLAGLECSYAVYSTRKHMPTAPRLRILFPLDRTVSADEYEPIARHLAAQIGIQMADATTFEACRLMYWPSCCQDGDYIFQYNDAPLISADKVLESYTNWRDCTSWPQVPGVAPYQRQAVKQGDPESKPGVVGAFNRAYPTVLDAMEQFLPGIYEPCDTDSNRYTYLGGSTTGGVVIYDDGKFLFSHHATDPCSGKLVNSFDLVRLHKFGDKDDDAAPSTPNNRLPSYQAMCELAVSDPAVAGLITRERQERMRADLEGLVVDPEEQDPNWLEHAGVKLSPKTGLPLPTMDNLMKLFRSDPALKGKMAWNEFTARMEVLGPLPWNQSSEQRRWTDTDLNGLYVYLETVYDITKRVNIDSALDVYTAEHSFNPLKDYLSDLEWDGVPRVDRLFVDYLGAEDDSYTRCVTRKILVAAVARAMNPGCKFDNMLVLCGTQGLGKSSILDRLAQGWFNDSILTFEGKEAAELIQGVWIVEIAELNAMKRSDVSRVKQFLSLRSDRFRPAYGRNVKEVPRACVFFGTVNDRDFLDDLTGNRRFWPVDVNVHSPRKKVWVDLTDAEVAQIWAEAKVRWQIGERLYLTPEEEQEAVRRQEDHREASPMEGLISDFIDQKVPADWDDWPLDRRRDFWAGLVHGDETQMVERTKICAMEIWLELYGGDRRYTSGNLEYKKIKPMLRKLLLNHGWVEAAVRVYNPIYGAQRAFIRLEDAQLQRYKNQ
jgi:predicted P-loop ATPase